MSNDQWGQPSQPGPSSWDPNSNSDDTQMRPADGTFAAQDSASIPSAGIPSATPPVSQASAWEDTGWVPTAQPTGADPSQQFGQQPAQQAGWGQPQAQQQNWGQAPGQPGQPPLQQGMQPQQGWGGQQPPQAQPGSLGHFFKGAFDLSFSTLHTPSIAKLIYLVTLVLGAITWLGAVIKSLVAATTVSQFSQGDASTIGWLYFVGTLLFGWILPFVGVLFVRVVLELAIATIRTSENTKELTSKD